VDELGLALQVGRVRDGGAVVCAFERLGEGAAFLLQRDQQRPVAVFAASSIWPDLAAIEP
jgi:hypothetical protein